MEDEFAGWHRVGGKVLQFYATDDEIADWLFETLPPEQGPYTLVGRHRQDDRWQSFEYPLSEVSTAFARHRSANHWIRSDALSPDLLATDEKRLAWNGLINVQLGSPGPDGRLGDASIGIVDRIRDDESGEERQFAAYLKLFERLRRSMRKRLVVETEYVQPDGRRYPHWRMTPRAAEAHVKKVVQFTADPVGLRD